MYRVWLQFDDSFLSSISGVENSSCSLGTTTAYARTFIVSTSPLGTTTASVATFIFSISETTETLTCRRRLLEDGAAP